MEGPLYHFLVVLPIFAAVLIFLVMPPLQWLSVRKFDRKFVLRFGGPWSIKDPNHRRDVAFSVIAFVISLMLSFAALQSLIAWGVLPPLK